MNEPGALLPVPTPRRSVFISYARADRPRVAPIAAALTAAGFDVWWDALIDGGAEFARTIEAELEGADVALVVWSKASIGSDWVRDEAAFARDRKRLVPVSLDGTEPPLGFRQYHAIDLSGWKGGAQAAEMAALVRAVAAIGSGAATVRTADRAVPRAAPSRRILLLSGGAVAASVVAGGLIAFHPWSLAKPDTSVAVLPFANLSGDPSQAYFSDGLSEEVRAALSRIAQLKVAAPTSSGMFRGADGDAKAIAAKLGVGFLLEGSVRKSGDLVRIAANLIDAGTGFSTWSQSFDRKLIDLFALQTEIANTVAEALTVQVASTENIPGSTKNVAAYDAFLRGREFYNSDTGEPSDRAALAQFNAALALDPNYASAHAARSRSLADVASGYAQANELRALYDAAIAAARRAVAIAPDLALGHLALGQAIFYGNLDPRGARLSYDRAASLSRGDADIGIAYAIFCHRVGRTADAQVAIDKALSLDPLNPRAYRAAGVIASVDQDQQKALALYAHALSLNPKLGYVRAYIGNARLKMRELAEARAAFAQEPNEVVRLTGLAIVDQKLNNGAAARQSFHAIVNTLGDSALYQQAEILAQWGDANGAVAALYRARSVGDAGLDTILIDPLLDPLRGTPQFSDLLKQLGFA